MKSSGGHCQAGEGHVDVVSDRCTVAAAVGAHAYCNEAKGNPIGSCDDQKAFHGDIADGLLLHDGTGASVLLSPNRQRGNVTEGSDRFSRCSQIEQRLIFDIADLIGRVNRRSEEG